MRGALARQRARAERRLDQVLGLRPRHQHPAIDVERPPVELLLAEEIGDRLAAQAPLEQPLEARRVVVADEQLGARQQRRLGQPEDAGQQQRRLARRRFERRRRRGGGAPRPATGRPESCLGRAERRAW